MPSPKVLFAGDSPVGGPANYLLAILKSMRATFHHIPPSKQIPPALACQELDLLILSDYPRAQLSDSVQKQLIIQAFNRMGVLMIGGWASFSGPLGNWKNSLIEKILPVRCSSQDDRVNLSGGALIFQKKKHPILKHIRLSKSPVICGLNRVLPIPQSETVLVAKAIIAGKMPRLGKAEYPLLVVHRNPFLRTAALTTDLAPHWCGGLLDWGTKRLRLPVKGGVQVEIGNGYYDFVASLIRWLSWRER